MTEIVSEKGGRLFHIQLKAHSIHIDSIFSVISDHFLFFFFLTFCAVFSC